MKNLNLKKSQSNGVVIDPRLSMKDLEAEINELDPIQDFSYREAVFGRLALLAKRDCLSRQDFESAERIINLLRINLKTELAQSIIEKSKAVKTLCNIFKDDEKLLDHASLIVNQQIGEAIKSIPTSFYSEQFLFIQSVKNSLHFAIHRNHTVHATIPIRSKVLKMTISPNDSMEKLIDSVYNPLGEALSELRLIPAPGEDVSSLFELTLQAARSSVSNIAFIYEDTLFIVTPYDSVSNFITETEEDVPVKNDYLSHKESLFTRKSAA